VKQEKIPFGEELVTKKEFDLVELTRRLGYPKATVHRMLLTLKP
jgi:DNA-binding IclR family transcriptional regulator